MLAVIKTGGKQYLVETGKKIKIEKIEGKEKQEINFPEVLLLADGENIKIGKPFVDGAIVKGEILRQAKAKKIIVFKYKPKKRERKKKGHRQPFTEVLIKEVK